MPQALSTRMAATKFYSKHAEVTIVSPRQQQVPSPLEDMHPCYSNMQPGKPYVRLEACNFGNFCFVYSELSFGSQKVCMEKAYYMHAAC